MRKILMTLLLTAGILAGTASLAAAEYRPESDLYLNLAAPVTVDPALTSTTGQTSFTAQESVYAAGGSTTSSVDHYYIWVCVNGSCALAIDPLRPSNN